MSALRALGVTSLSLLMPASLLVAAPGSAAETDTTTASGYAATTSTTTSTSKVARQRVRLKVLPQIVQPGGRVASANAAKASLMVKVKPITAGRQLKLQVKRGSSWRTVDKAREDRRGRALFAARASKNGKPLTYRVKAVRYQGLKVVKSRKVSTERWLTPTWTDQFSGSKLSSYWGHRGGSYEPQSLRNCSRGAPRAVRVGGGAVRLSVMRDSTRAAKCAASRRGQVAGRYAYRINGHIGTDHTFGFKYGVAAARIKFPRLRGQHGSFWLQPFGGMNPDTTGHEIDVIESFGPHRKRSGLWTYIHRYEKGRVVKRGTTISNSYLNSRRDRWWKNYHVFSVQWTPHKLVFRIDGKETWRVGGRVSRVPQYLILSVLSSDYELPLIKDRQLPQHMYVDWVRVWETGG